MQMPPQQQQTMIMPPPAPVSSTPNLYPIVDTNPPMGGAPMGGAPMGGVPIGGQPMMAGGLLGKLKLHLKEANLQHNDAGFLERMNPQVFVRINNREERS